MSEQLTIQTIKLKYYDHEFSVIPAKVLNNQIKSSMLDYLRNIGDIAFIVDEELYFDEGALFNLTMKYCDTYIFI